MPRYSAAYGGRFDRRREVEPSQERPWGQPTPQELRARAADPDARPKDPTAELGAKVMSVIMASGAFDPFDGPLPERSAEEGVE